MRLFVFILTALILLGGVYLLLGNTQQATESILVSFADTQNNFSLQYSAETALVNTSPFGETFSGTAVARIDLLRGTTTTNLSEASVLVGVTTSPQAVSSCLTPTAEEQVKGKRTISGAEFSIFEGHGAAAGNRYDTKNYRAVRDTTCYEIRELIHYGVFENYEPGSVVEFDAQKTSVELESIALSFKFVK